MKKDTVYLMLVFFIALILATGCGKDTTALVPAEPTVPAASTKNLTLEDLAGRYYSTNYDIAVFIDASLHSDQPRILFERFVGTNPEEQCDAPFNIENNTATLVTNNCDASWPPLTASSPITQDGHTVTILGLVLVQ